MTKNDIKLSEAYKMILKEIFKDCRVVALAGEKNSGKTNNLVYLLKQLREKNKDIKIYAYGMEKGVMDYLSKELKIKEISSLSHIVGKKNCLLILDEFQGLKLNDSRYRDVKAKFMDFIYHNNVYCILSSPNIREFNTIIGGDIEKWLLKSVTMDRCMNGSQLKKVVQNYKGRHKQMDSIIMPKDKILVINNEEEIVLNCKYVKEADNKAANESIF